MQEFVSKINEFGYRKVENNINYTLNYCLFRGHKEYFPNDPEKNWKLRSVLERNFTIKDIRANKEVLFHYKFKHSDLVYIDIYQKILKKYKKHLRELNLENNTLSDEEIWAYGRHFGLLTPYLDWSFNPYIALFFAFSKYYNNYIWQSRMKTRPEGEFCCVYRCSQSGIKLLIKNSFPLLKFRQKQAQEYMPSGVFLLFYDQTNTLISSHIYRQSDRKMRLIVLSLNLKTRRIFLVT
ncbi:MAG TPA: hypothetical protein DC049_12785 [Spirochaetia bacterium]|nr:hypothetical protein [Spirochaetia bacterium]